MMFAQKKAKVFRAEECPMQEQAGAPAGICCGGACGARHDAERVSQVGGGATATAEENHRRTAQRFEVDLLDSWCKP